MDIVKNINTPNAISMPMQAWIDDDHSIILEMSGRDGIKTFVEIGKVDMEKWTIDNIFSRRLSSDYSYGMASSVYDEDLFGCIYDGKYVIMDIQGKTRKVIFNNITMQLIRGVQISIDSPVIWLSPDQGVFMNYRSKDECDWYYFYNHEGVSICKITSLPDSTLYGQFAIIK